MNTRRVGNSVERKCAVNIAEILADAKSSGNSFTERNQGRILEYYLVGIIEEPTEYVDWFDEIRHASPNDIVKIYINSEGGDLFTSIQFLRIINECPATVIGSVEGACMSAATIIFLSCSAFEVSSHSNFMFHNYSGLVVGKGGEMKDQLAFEAKWSEDLMRSVYADFLTENEIASILDGKDIWMNGTQVVERLNKRQEIKNAQEAAKESKPST